MALQVWLPLNKSVNRNCGLNNGISTTNTAVFSSTGSPVNGCYTFTTGQSITLSGVDFSKLKSCSISLWVYQNAKKNTVFFTGPSTSHYVVASHSDGTSDFYHSGNVGGTKKTYVDGVQAVKLGSAGAWHHYVITDVNLSAWTGTTLYFNNYSSGFNFAGRVCDIRIYDNVLTDEDVKELYRNNIYHFVPFWKHNTNMQFGDAAYFGQSINQAPYNISISGSSAYFNGSAYIEFNSLNLTGGTLSMWVNVASKPSAQKMLYYDPVSKMVLGFLSDGNFLSASNGSKARYLSTGMTWGQWNHVVATWGTDRQPSGVWVNGVACGTGNTTNWTTAGTACAIGRRLGVSGYDDYFTGYINSVKVFQKVLTSAEIVELYNKGVEEKDSSVFKYVNYSGCTWYRVLHHNTPATKLFTSANGKRNDDTDLYSRLGLFDSNTNFRMADNKYEFLVREKLESTHTESAATWVQTSSPTASTISGFQLLSSNPPTPPRTFGLTHQSANAVFDDSGTNTWWCACGCNTAYQGGIPGFYGNVKTGYLDLYVRVDDTKYLGIAEVPSDYTVLQYIEANGTQWIDTNVSGFNTTDWEIFCEWKLSAAPAGTYAYVFGVYEAETSNTYRVITNQKSTTDYYANPCSKAGGGSISVTGLSSASTHTVLLKGDGKFTLNGSNYTSGTFGDALPAGNTMGLFRTKKSDGTFTNFFKGRIYAFWAKKNGSYVCNLVPAKRNSDNVVGMYDVARRIFLTNSGTGTFTAGATVTI